jgi:DTW domain-containing protein YfiP
VRELCSEVELLILQHPAEAQQAKGSVRLLSLCHPRCRVEVGDVFDPALLAGSRRNLLVYPGAPAPAGEAEPGALRLILIDGTWRKSRLILHRNPWLAELPRLSLSGLPPSGYLIRRAQAVGQLSTMEAAAHSLERLEPGAAVPLLAAFGEFVAQQLRLAGRASPSGSAGCPG